MTSNINNVTIKDLLSKFPVEGITVKLTFTKEDIWDVLMAEIFLNNKSGIFNHIISEVITKKK